ncbi:hypothetical protein PPL_05726 [Heterostelium album PN500]|uniref:Oxysterol-binding protein n=1 Tax=Heterostelium pallidum (strain ATCC 26659 / Pp 5 / PN500) TaxID=670386 RepID=D3BAZ5_HETP5|nr:hypothetical protein PPL_05726 [Heterostelium album PN500]EFA81732.1 hypothetical protein PPL_05726 [Heterostelium album PN500]|eukprot:XP_020433849.1 hypothetical protein PPL_05726 [Heterostelium album PN500]
MAKEENFEDVGEEIPEEFKKVDGATTTVEEIDEQVDKGGATAGNSAITSMLKSMKVGTDMSNMVMPGSFILPRSTLGYFAENCSGYFDQLIQCNAIDDPMERMLQVYRYLMSTRYIPKDVSKKPLNPVLGETSELKTNFPNINATAHSLCEQISHHPPISSSIVYGSGVSVAYYSPIKGAFMGTYIKLNLDGHLVIKVDKFNEEYHCTLPSMAIRMFRGFGEFIGNSTLTCTSNNFSIQTKFLPKPLLIGNYNVIEGKVFKGKDKVFKLKGQWDGEVKISPYKKDDYKHFFEKSKLTPGVAEPIPEIQLLPTDSTKIWGGLFAAAKSSASSRDITREKTLVEEDQRKKAQERKTKGEEWKPNHFTQDKEGRWILNSFKN